MLLKSDASLILLAGRVPWIPAAAAFSAVSSEQELAGQEAVENKDLHVLLCWQPMLRQHAQ